MHDNDVSVQTLGHLALDEDHQVIARLIEGLRQASPVNMLEAFGALHASLSAHFAEEDSMMARHDFGSKSCHLDEHAAVLRSFGEVRPYAMDGDSRLVARFARELAEWLPAHVDALDRHLAERVFFHATGGSRVTVRRRPSS